MTVASIGISGGPPHRGTTCAAKADWVDEQTDFRRPAGLRSDFDGQGSDEPFEGLTPELRRLRGFAKVASVGLEPRRNKLINAVTLKMAGKHGQHDNIERRTEYAAAENAKLAWTVHMNPAGLQTEFTANCGGAEEFVSARREEGKGPQRKARNCTRTKPARVGWTVALTKQSRHWRYSGWTRRIGQDALNLTAGNVAGTTLRAGLQFISVRIDRGADVLDETFAAVALIRRSKGTHGPNWQSGLLIRCAAQSA